MYHQACDQYVGDQKRFACRARFVLAVHVRANVGTLLLIKIEASCLSQTSDIDKQEVLK